MKQKFVKSAATIKKPEKQKQKYTHTDRRSTPRAVCSKQTVLQCYLRVGFARFAAHEIIPNLFAEWCTRANNHQPVAPFFLCRPSTHRHSPLYCDDSKKPILYIPCIDHHSLQFIVLSSEYFKGKQLHSVRNANFFFRSNFSVWLWLRSILAWLITYLQCTFAYFQIYSHQPSGRTEWIYLRAMYMIVSASAFSLIATELVRPTHDVTLTHALPESMCEYVNNIIAE